MRNGGNLEALHLESTVIRKEAYGALKIIAAYVIAVANGEIADGLTVGKFARQLVCRFHDSSAQESWCSSAGCPMASDYEA